MKNFKLVILLFFVMGCSDKKTKNKSFEFDTILGKNNVETLNFLVTDFENNFLIKQYPNYDIEVAYRHFLTDLQDNKTSDFPMISRKARERFKSSDLRLEMYQFPDSVWVLVNSTFDKIEADSLNYFESPFPYLKSRYKYQNLNGSVEYSYSRYYGENIQKVDFDSIIKSEMNLPQINFIGKYLQAIESIKNTSDFYKEFYDVKKSAGFLFPESTARVMLNYGIDLKNKLNRKIIVLELVY